MTQKKHCVCVWSLFALVCINPTDALTQRRKSDLLPSDRGCDSRREVFKAGFAGLAFLATTAPGSAGAFENKISTKYDDRPKRRGPKPKDLGVSKRMDIVGEEYQGLKHCGAAPNCFVSTDNAEDDPDHSIPSWKWPEELGDDSEKAFAQLVSTINSYKPGQSNVDGGGFKIIANEKGYVYTQFESLKNGYIDDVEFALIDAFGKRSVQVRSSSRIGYLDYGVNAKRLNYIANDLRSQGWDAPGVEYKSHQNYVIQNELQ
eukprot:CAMPEP_0197190030 /NCGR_PEP_ID=MMETSP1423-20130617/20865_1 /TAXON_ID=476441 /ORGANISM="Pseudo-nitzschia heimii, Strain UNC1101" /LENGTH=259 /DNA_ID=CAMNT_0042642309 /DNA_START=80 /DNA_END=859 /DNA_ORIENTATION=+